MSIYKCFIFLLMAFMAVNGQVDISVKGIVINAGNDYSFHCRFPNNLENVYWFRTPDVGSQSAQFISHLQPRKDVPIYYYPSFVGPHVACQHIVSTSPGYDIFSLTVFNMTIADSALYACSSTDFLRRYDTEVVDCSCIVTTDPLLDHGTARKRKNVTCTLHSNPIPNFIPAQTIIRRSNNLKKQYDGSVAGNNVTFTTNNALQNDLTITLNPFPHFEGNISCIVPAVLTPALITQMITTIMSTSSQDPMSVSTPSHTGNPYHDTPKETDKQKYASERDILIVLSAVGWSVVLMLVIALVTIGFHRRRERAPSGSTPGRHDTGEEQVEVEETDMSYASIPDTAPPGRAKKILGTERGEVDVSTFPSDGVVGSHLYDFTIDDSRRELTTDPSTAGRHAGQSKQVRQHIPPRC